jgi:hypothetical protein
VGQFVQQHAGRLGRVVGVPDHRHIARCALVVPGACGADTAAAAAGGAAAGGVMVGALPGPFGQEAAPRKFSGENIKSCRLFDY